jgi:hypothetical protein
MTSTAGSRLVGAARVGALLAALFAATDACANPDFSGVWLVDAKVQELKTDRGEIPPLTAEAARVYSTHVAKWRAGDLSFDPTAKCVSPGIPRMLYLPYPFEIIQSPKRITYLFQWNYWNRHVDMSGRKLEAPYPLAMGESRGHFEGNELVIDSDGFRADNTLLDSAGLPHSEKLQLTERLRLKSGGALLEDRIRIQDPATFTHPWETVVEFRRLPATYEIPMDVCLDRTDAGKPAVDWSRKLLP